MSEIVLSQFKGSQIWDPSSEIALYIDNSPIRKIPMFFPQKSFKLPSNGLLSIKISHKSTVLASVSIPACKIPTSSVSWLPLFTEGSGMIDEMPYMCLLYTSDAADE